MKDADALTPAQIAKAALRRLALAKQEPTPENYAQAWAEEAGDGQVGAAALPPRARSVLDKLAARATDDPALRADLAKALNQGRWDDALRQLDRGAESASAQSQAWAQLIERLARGLERGGKQWTLARKKDSLQRVLDASRSDMQRMQHRLKQLVGSWDGDEAVPEATAAVAPPHGEPAAGGETPASAPAWPAATAPADATPAHNAAAQADRAALALWPDVMAPLEATVRAALPQDAPRAVALADELQALAARLAAGGANPQVAAEVAEVCQRARRLLSHRHHLLDQVHRLSRELAGGLAELSEDDSWVRGQVSSLRERLDETLSARAVQAASELLAHTRAHQRDLRSERDRARQALKELIHRMLSELGELDQHTGRFSDGMLRYAETIEQADSLESLAGVVREMVEESRSVHALVSSTRERLHGEHSRAMELEVRVRELEGELRRLSEEVATDALTQIANRRGLMQHFETERARMAREGGELAVGLLDIDNFKRLNDSLGHAAGDQALVALAEHVRKSLRPVDVVARFGGEEFVVLLPGTPLDEAQRVLSRLQRLLSASLFMHDGQEVFVTFSAGVTAYRAGEPLEDAMERADEALYEAKRTGKNRTCTG
jgi:diguanylate cyclase